ncbi:hypothetical protein PtA15_14A147 [Puccinia triticina]|uniref:Uncharacterized protein n=1 Tax=Puccinia triticina TaxID=208348 RepID=A0ABY7D5K3_9BASI|nr:uncharacterized protein PtA15_14A147 [Puccinia triticina]WAQ91265.1 hypothetical protein PtA15_14A147 [Puccinia triticina]
MSDRVQAVTDGFRNKNQNPVTNPNAPPPEDPTTTASSPATRTAAPAIPAEGETSALHHPAPSMPRDAAAKKSKTHKNQGKNGNPNRFGKSSADAAPNSTNETGTRNDPDLSKRFEADDTDDESTEAGIEVLDPTPKDSSKGKASPPVVAPKSVAWNDENIATLVEKHLAAEKAGDQEASDLYFAMFKSLMSTKPPVHSAQTPVSASAEDLSNKARPKKLVNPDPYAKYALIPKYHDDEENHSDAVAKAPNVANTAGPSSLPEKPAGGRAPKGSGYKGNNFDPNHAAKQGAQGNGKAPQ